MHYSIDKQVTEIRNCANTFKNTFGYYDQVALVLDNAADTITELQKNIEESKNNGYEEWTLFSEKYPSEKEQYYIVTVRNKVSDLIYTRLVRYDCYGFSNSNTEELIAWLPIPRPYKLTEK